jgi:hypothetical protein
MDMPNASRGQPGVPRVFVGVLVVGIGLISLAERLTVLDVDRGGAGDGWPLVALAVGVAPLVACADRDARRRASRAAGWVLAIGVWGLLNEYRLFDLEYAASWPLLIVYLGIDMVWKSVQGPRCTIPDGRTR